MAILSFVDTGVVVSKVFTEGIVVSRGFAGARFVMRGFVDELVVIKAFVGKTGEGAVGGTSFFAIIVIRLLLVPEAISSVDFISLFEVTGLLTTVGVI